MERYADPSDRATAEQELLLADQLRVAQENKPQVLPYIGECHNCEAKLPPLTRFCDADCRDDFERRGRFNNPR